MKACELHIIIEQSDKTFALGDTLRGVVVVDVIKTTKCDGLKITKFWRTHGRGDINEGPDASQTLFNGEWQPGHYEYPFEFELNERNTSYHGEIVNLDWYLNASADVPWAFDPSAEEDFLLLTKHLAEDYHYRQRAQIEYRERQNQATPFLMTIIPLVIFAAIGIFFFNVDSKHEQLSSVFERFFEDLVWLIPVVMVGGGLVFLFQYLSGKRVQKLLDDLRVTIPNTVYLPGDTIEASLSCTPLRNLSTEYCYAQLVGQEIAVDNSGTTSTTHKHEIYFDEVPVDLPKQLMNHVPVSKEFRFELPENIPSSFNTGENSIRWSMKIDLRLNRWLRWSNSNIIKIRHST